MHHQLLSAEATLPPIPIQQARLVKDKTTNKTSSLSHWTSTKTYMRLRLSAYTVLGLYLRRLFCTLTESARTAGADANLLRISGLDSILAVSRVSTAHSSRSTSSSPSLLQCAPLIHTTPHTDWRHSHSTLNTLVMTIKNLFDLA